MSDTTRHKENNTVIDEVQGGEKKVMTKFNKRIINVLATATLVAGVAAPVTTFVAPSATIYAAGGGEVRTTNTPTVVADDRDQRFGNVVFTIPENTTLQHGDQVNIELPYDLNKKKGGVTDAVYNFIPGYDFSAFEDFDPESLNSLTVKENGAIGNNKIDKSHFVVVTEDSDEANISVRYDGPTKVVSGDPLEFVLTLGALYVEKGENGDAEVVVDAPSSSAFPSGKAVVGVVNDENNSLNISFSSLDTSNEDFDPKIVIQEPFKGALSDKTDLTITLPKGYKWTGLRKDSSIKRVYGDLDVSKIGTDYKGDNGRELVITYTGKPSTIDSKIEIPFDFVVDDSTKVKKGDIIAKISGKTKTNISEGKIGTYGEYEATLTAEDAPTLVAGQDEQEIAEFHLTEAIGDSLVTGTNGRYLEITLPEGARWQNEYEADLKSQEDKTTVEPAALDDLSDEGVRLTFEGFTGTNKRTAKYKVHPRTNTDAATLDFEDLEVALAADFTGDLKVTVDGSAGVKGEVVVAKVVAPVTAVAKNGPEVIIGAREQKGADFTITENIAGALTDEGELILDLPEGVRFASKPTIEVTSGDMEVSNVKLIKDNGTDDNAVSFRVDSESDTASTISVSNVNLILDRTVPEGTVTLYVKGGAGNAAAETAAYSDWEDNDTVAKVEVAKVSTPAPVEESKGNTVSVFKIGSTSYTVNGATYTADVAPYIENGRTFLPVRYVADALGVAPQNIKFDKKTSTVTLLKGDRIVQIKLKTNILTINGAAINMDVKAVTKNNRTVLPISWVGQALGADIKWDKDTNTVTVTQK